MAVTQKWLQGSMYSAAESFIVDTSDSRYPTIELSESYETTALWLSELYAVILHNHQGRVVHPVKTNGLVGAEWSTINTL